MKNRPAYHHPICIITLFRPREFIGGKHIGGDPGPISQSVGNSCYGNPNKWLVNA